MKIDMSLDQIIPREFYARDTVLVAQELLSKKIVCSFGGQLCSGIITETEAYRSNDPACHACKGRTERNKALFGPVGFTYVYFTYGMHFCLNIVARDAKVPAGGVLIRAIHPLQGIATMQQRRNRFSNNGLVDGPAKLTQAFGITTAHQHIDVTVPGSLYITSGIVIEPKAITATPRIGITAGQDLLWRFVCRI